VQRHARTILFNVPFDFGQTMSAVCNFSYFFSGFEDAYGIVTGDTKNELNTCSHMSASCSQEDAGGQDGHRPLAKPSGQGDFKSVEAS